MAVPTSSLLASGLAKLARNAPISVPEGMAIADHVASQSGLPGTGAASPYAGFHRVTASPGHLSGEGNDSGGGGGGTSFWGALKNIGTTALNTLATPGNALLTAAGNLGLEIAGKPLMPWSDAIGAFEGRSPGQDLLAHSGVGPGLLRTLGGIGLDIGVDPLWLTGAGAIPKVGEAVGGVTHALEGGTEAARAGRVAADVTPDVIPLATERAAVKMQHDINIPKGLHPTLGKVAGSQRGRLVDDNLFVFRANKNNANPLFKIARVADPAHLKPTDTVLPYEFRSAAEAEQGAHGLAQAKRMAASEGNLLEGGIITPSASREAMTQGTARAVSEASVPKEYAVRLGVGKLGENTRFSHTFRTGISPRGKSLSMLGMTGPKIREALDTRLVKHPLAKVIRNTERRARDIQQGMRLGVMNFGKSLGLDTLDSKRLGTYLLTRESRPGVTGAKLMRGHMEDMGIWKPEYDEAVRVFDAHSAQMAKDLGYHSTQDLPRLKAEIEQHVLASTPEDDVQALYKQHIVNQLEGKPYFPAGRHPEVNKVLQDAVHTEGPILGDVRSGGYLPGANPFMERDMAHPFAGVSHEDAVAQLESELGITHDQADTLAHVMNAVMERSTGRGFAEETHMYVKSDGSDLVKYKPNLDAFDLFSTRVTAQVQKQLDDSFRSALEAAGITDERAIQDVRSLTLRSPNMKNVPGSLSSGKLSQIAMRATTTLKKLFTTVLPAHYIRNAASDYQNDLVNGNLFHLLSGPEIGLSPQARLIRAERGAKGSDEALLQKVYTVGKRDYTGEELLAMARLSGASVSGGAASHGFIGEDIRGALDMINGAVTKSRNPFKRYSDFMGQMNVDRENAQRLRTWVNHMQGGDDMFTAASKTIRAKFDYGDLTNWEKVWGRNLFLFYTWLRKNTPLHVGGLATRPGLYASAGQIEAGRPKFPNEPPYMSTLGLLPTPVGNIAFGGAINDAMNKLDLSQIRQSTVGQFTPLAQIPISLLTGTDIVTGNPLPSHPVPSIYGYLPGIGTTASAFSRGPIGHSIPPWLQEIVGSLSPSPIAAAGAVTNAGYEGKPGLDLLGRLTGIQSVQNQPAKFAAVAAIKRAEARKQLATIKRYNVGSQP